MSGEARRSAEEYLLELARERRGRQLAESEANNQRRFAEYVDRIATAAMQSPNVEALSETIVQIFCDVTRADAAVLRLRDGDKLRSHAAIGLADELALGFSHPADVVPAPVGTVSGPPRHLFVASAECRSELVSQKGLLGFYGLPLTDGDDLRGVVFFGTREEREFTEHEQLLFNVLASRAGRALAHHSSFGALEQAIRSRDDVLSVVAHDLQNPINVISIAASMLLQRLSDASARRPLERIIRGAQRADRLIRDLLEVNAIETGRFSIQRRRMEAADLILAALESQQGLAADASVIIATDLSPELPLVEADEERLLEVLENLIGNSVKFTAPGGSITVGAARHGEAILVSVKDTGSGIAPDQLPHIFDRFWQAQKAHRRGTGLGLTICKAIVEAHGGNIWAESALGMGTTMFFTLPANSIQPPLAAQEVVKILIVDDRPENILALTSILDRPDYELVTATSGEEALRLALRERFAVALIDVAMPGMSGLEVAGHMKELERSRDIPIIFITAFGDDPEQIHRAYAAGGADYLVKPLDIEIVRKKVAVFVDLSRRREEHEQRR